jgi:hypothetical protein
VLAVATTVLYVTAPKNGDFWWSEAPRNALNGAFILDLLRELPFDDPVSWAVDYYYQYPALTILFYPPLFHAVLAVFYLVFGVSHATAVACVSAFFAVLVSGVAKFSFQVQHRYAPELRWEHIMISSTLMSVTSCTGFMKPVQPSVRLAA